MKVFADRTASPDPAPLDERSSYREFDKKSFQIEELPFLELPPIQVSIITIFIRYLSLPILEIAQC